MKLRSFSLTVLVCSLTALSSVHATDYYVNAAHPQSADSNVGTVDLPFRTIQHGADVAQAGDNVLVQEGTYPERVTLRASGTSSSPITFIALPRRSVDMQGFYTATAAYVRIEGFNITTRSTEWDKINGILIGSHHVEVVDNYFTQIPSAAITGGRGEYLENSHDIVVADNEIFRCEVGIVASGNDWLVENNTISQIVQLTEEGDCDYIRFFGDRITIRGNTLYGTNLAEVGSSHVGCFTTFDRFPLENCNDILIDGNTCSDFHEGFNGEADYYHSSFRITIANNIFAHGDNTGVVALEIANVHVFNNTFYDIRYRGVSLQGDQAPGGVVENNIFVSTGSSYEASGGADLAGDFNLTFNSQPSFHGGPNDINNQDPLFIDGANGNFRLHAASPAIDRGNEIPEVTTDFDGLARPQGAGWDMGAFEVESEASLIVRNITLAHGQVGVAYYDQLTAVGGAAPYTWSLTAGTLPDGLSLDGATGAIQGNPSRVGRSTFTVEVTDGDGDRASKELEIVVLAEAQADAGVFPDLVIPQQDVAPHQVDMASAPSDIPPGGEAGVALEDIPSVEPEDLEGGDGPAGEDLPGPGSDGASVRYDASFIMPDFVIPDFGLGNYDAPAIPIYGDAPFQAPPADSTPYPPTPPQTQSSTPEGGCVLGGAQEGPSFLSLAILALMAGLWLRPRRHDAP